MINSFLATLHNSATPPTNPSSVVGDVLWPAPYTPKVYTGPAQLANNLLFDNQTDPLFHFLTAIQLLWVVQESVLVDRIVLDDVHTSYNQIQLIGQFIDTDDYDRQQISRILGIWESIPALQFLTGDLLHVYRSSLSRMDRLAAVICYFGNRND